MEGRGPHIKIQQVSLLLLRVLRVLLLRVLLRVLLLSSSRPSFGVSVQHPVTL